MPLRTITLPKRDGSEQTEEIEYSQSLVIVGANGSGKSRLGIWLEGKLLNEYRIVRLISAQRSLQFATSIPPKSVYQAESELIWGANPDSSATWNLPTKIRNRKNYLWGGDTYDAMLNDYDKLLAYLIAQTHSAHTDYFEKSKKLQNSGDLHAVTIPKTSSDKCKEIWDSIMPHRSININVQNGKIEAKVINGDTYHGKEMSDGERVALYLIAQCVCTPENSVLLLDEPESHLHRSLMNCLWTQLEIARPDCTFIYITHDLDFAASRSHATKIWMQEFNGQQGWKWLPLKSQEELPEALVLELLGNRKPVLFVEGVSGGLDHIIYQAYYPDWFVKPFGSCSDVILATKAFKKLNQYHTLQVCGIIDCDRRTDEELQALEDKDILHIAVAELENLFCTREVIEVVANHLHKTENVNVAIDFIINKFKTDIENQQKLHLQDRTLRKLDRFVINDASKAVDEFQTFTSDIQKEIDVINGELKQSFEAAINDNDLPKILRFFNSKGLLSEIAGKIGLLSKAPNTSRHGAYADLVIAMINSTNKAEKDNIIGCFSNYLPQLPTIRK